MAFFAFTEAGERVFAGYANKGTSYFDNPPNDNPQLMVFKPCKVISPHFAYHASSTGTVTKGESYLHAWLVAHAAKWMPIPQGATYLTEYRELHPNIRPDGYFNHDNQHHVLEVVVTHDIEPETFEAYAALNVVLHRCHANTPELLKNKHDHHYVALNALDNVTVDTVHVMTVWIQERTRHYAGIERNKFNHHTVRTELLKVANDEVRAEREQALEHNALVRAEIDKHRKLIQKERDSLQALRNKLTVHNRQVIATEAFEQTPQGLNAHKAVVTAQTKLRTIEADLETTRKGSLPATVTKAKERFPVEFAAMEQEKTQNPSKVTGTDAYTTWTICLENTNKALTQEQVNTAEKKLIKARNTLVKRKDQLAIAQEEYKSVESTRRNETLVEHQQRAADLEHAVAAQQQRVSEAVSARDEAVKPLVLLPVPEARQVTAQEVSQEIIKRIPMDAIHERVLDEYANLKRKYGVNNE